jgi:integrase/recombinase XerD
MNSEWVERWLSNFHGKTLASYRYTAQKFHEAMDVPMEQAKPQQVRAWLNELDVELTTKQKHLNHLKAFFGWLIEESDTPIKGHPLGRRFKLPKPEHSLSERILSPEDTWDLIEAARFDSEVYHLGFKTIYLLGLRVSELCGLKWRNFSKRKDKVSVSVYGKGGKTRQVVVPDELWKEIQELRGDRASTDYIFSSHLGKALLPATLHRAIKRAAKRARIENWDLVSCHWLRHSHVTHALDSGAPAHLVKDNVGHASLETTGKYAHLLEVKGSGDYLLKSNH